MSRTLTRAALTALVLLALPMSWANPAWAFYQPPQTGIKPKPVVPYTTSVAVASNTTDENGPSYWTLVDSLGVTDHGDAPDLHGPAGYDSYGTIVPTPTGKGYWVVEATGGGVDSFGDAWKAPSFNTTGYWRYSSTTAISDAVPTPDGHGLIAVDVDGHVWTLGTARSYGDVVKAPKCVSGRQTFAVAIRLNEDASGYVIVNATGELWSRGSNVPTYGQLCNWNDAAITSFAFTPDHRGYWLVDSTGRVHAFGDAPAHLPGTLTNPKSVVTYVAALPDGGYLLAHENGAVDVFGPAASRNARRHAAVNAKTHTYALACHE